MTPGTTARSLVGLGSGVYTVSEVCRILQPGMTSRKVHYWLNTGLLSEPIRWGSRGFATLLTYRQLLEIRTVQHVREELEFSLPKVRAAIAWILEALFSSDWTGLQFVKGVDGSLVARSGSNQVVVPGGQGVLEGALPDLNAKVATTRRAWEEQAYAIAGRRYIVSDPRVLAGAPTIRGTRVDTSLVALGAEGEPFDRQTLAEITRAYPRLAREAVIEALEFEGVSLIA